MSLTDRGYVAGIHPLELWLVNYLQDHPGAARNEVMEASAQVREEAYAGCSRAARISRTPSASSWSRMHSPGSGSLAGVGFPFGHLVPSLGTAIGASGDRPEALAELMGIILNDGMRLPSVSIERLHFATDTPYETNLSAGKPPERVMSHEVALTLKRALTGGRHRRHRTRLRGTSQRRRGHPLEVGGKTGTGDNRYDHFAAGGGIISSRVVDRTATFVFYIGDRFFGTVTAYVPGADAGRYHFTSALAVQLLKSLEPELRPLIKGKEPVQQALLGSSHAPAAPRRRPAARTRTRDCGGRACRPGPASSPVTASRPAASRRRIGYPGDLADQLAGHRLGEAFEILDREEKRAGAADHVLLVVFRQSARRLGVEGIARVGSGVDDRQPVDRHPGGDRLVARFGDRAAGIVGAVARDVDDPLVRLGGGARQSAPSRSRSPR